MSATYSDQAKLLLAGYEPKRLKGIAEVLSREMKMPALSTLASLRQAIDDRFESDFASAIELIRHGPPVQQPGPVKKEGKRNVKSIAS